MSARALASTSSSLSSSLRLRGGATPGADCRRSLVELGADETGLVQALPCKLRGDRSSPEDDHAVANRDQLAQIAGRPDHGAARLAELRHQVVDRLATGH